MDIVNGNYESSSARTSPPPSPARWTCATSCPSARQHDLLLKRERYQRASVPHYWVVDPNDPRILAWQLREGEYVSVADVSGAEAWNSPLPFAVTLVPDDLVR